MCASAIPAAQQNRRPLVPPAVRAQIEAVVEAYEGGDDLAVERWMRRPEGVRALSALPYVIVPQPWSRSRAAVFLESAVVLAGGQAFRSVTLLEAGRAFLAARPSLPGTNPIDDEFEMRWHRAALGILQGLSSGVPPGSHYAQQQYLTAIEPRLRPADASGLNGSRIPLSRAIAAAGICCPQQAVRDGTRRSGDTPQPAMERLPEVVGLFVAAGRVSDLRIEAHVRAAVLLHASGKPGDALQWLDQVPADPDDRLVAYVQALTRGRVMDALQRPADAAAAYEAARRIEPAAQLPAVGLAAALLKSGRPDDAIRMAEVARRLPVEPVDLRREFQRADVRFVRTWLDEIRRLRR